MKSICRDQESTSPTTIAVKGNMAKGLRDPGKEIRLLYLEPGSIDERIDLRLSICRLRDAPDYSAISYMWGGEEEEQTVYIDGAARTVRRNCYDALCQAREHFPASYVWIDSLCINQDDLDEKAQQVNLMGTIYRVAERVLVCIGPDDGGISCVRDAFMKEEGRFTELVERVAEEEELEDFEEVRDLVIEFWEKWIEDRPLDFVELFQAGIEDFSTRKYWQRQWIVQEILQARHKVVLCGKLTIPWVMVQFVRLMVYTQSETFDVKPRRWFLDIVSDVRGGLRTLEMWLRTEYKCQDIRDRIFSGLHAVEWNPSLPKVTADYRMSVMDLAKIAITHMGEWGVQPVLNALGLDMHSKEMEQLIRQRDFGAPSHLLAVSGSGSKKKSTLWKRFRNKVSENATTSRPSPQEFDKHRSSDVSCMRKVSLTYDRLEEDSNGRLICRSLGYNPYMDSIETKAERADLILRSLLDKRVTKTKTHRPIELYSGGYHDDKSAAILCPKARAGDFVTKLSKFDHICLVFRRETDSNAVFNLIGQGFVFWDYDLGSMSGFPGVDESFRNTFCTNLSDEDFIALSGQDLIHMTPLFEADDPDAYDCTARVQRPFTRVSLSAKPQMWIVDESDSHDDSDEN